MRSSISLARFEGDLRGMIGGVTLYRRGLDEFFLSVGLPRMYEETEALRAKLESIGMYERVRDALKQVEAWVAEGPAHDSAAENLLLEVGAELARASGSEARLRRRLRDNPDLTLDDLKSDMTD